MTAICAKQTYAMKTENFRFGRKGGLTWLLGKDRSLFRSGHSFAEVRQALREGVAQSTSVVEDDPDGFSHSEADSANAVTQVDAIVALP